MATILLTGGTGMIGTHLQKFLADKGYSLIILIRDGTKAKSSNNNVIYKKWNGEDVKIPTIEAKEEDPFTNFEKEWSNLTK